MSRSAARERTLLVPYAPWIVAALVLALAIAAGIVLAQLLMSPPAGDLRALAAYLAISGAATMAGGWLLLRLVDRAARVGLRAKAFLGAATAGGVALLNVYVVARLMFVSSTHDLRLLIALLVSSSVITLFLSLHVASTVVGRLRLMTEGIRKLTQGQYDESFGSGGGDEVATLARDLEALARRLRASEAERRDLTAAISHDLRTPLASVRAMAEALDDRVVEDEGEVHRYYALMRREIERLNRMIDDLFELAQLDSGALKLERRPLALESVVEDVVDAMQAQARQNGVHLAFKADSLPSPIPIDGARVERAVANLMRNALEHAPAGGCVEVSVFANDGWAAVRVVDDGPGLDERDQHRIWDRFYRGDRSRRRAELGSDGAGLGLAIVRGIVEAHGGTVEAGRANGRGAAFTMRLPARTIDGS